MTDVDKAYDFVKTLNLSEGSKKKYISQLRKLFNITKKDIKGSFEDIENIKKIAYEIKNKDGIYVLNTAFGSIDTILNFIDKYKKNNPNIITDENFKIITDIRNDLAVKRRIVVDAQLPKTNITLEECYKLMDSYEEDSLEYLFMACNLLLPPRRADWNNCVFVEELPEKLEEINYIVIGKHVRLVFNNYKDTVQKVLGTWDRVLINDNFKYLEYTNKFSKINPEKLGQLLINSYNKNKRKYLFEKEINKYNKFIAKVLKKDNAEMKQTLFRNILLNEFKKINTDASIKRALAHDMGQSSLETQMLYTQYIPDIKDDLKEKPKEEIKQDLVRLKLIERIKEAQKDLEDYDRIISKCI